ncbi:AAA family ATPase [Marinobacter sp. OP 3.4]|uniref:AAA family ATPase n=1 Tax=Marinobacter sp. OP 3.4 TaxID=3076501 RepID=UPI002E1A3B52
MRLSRARVQNYRSIIDTGEFDLERDKSIFVGPNEAGKSAVLQALQQINRPVGVKPLNYLRDYPRRLLRDITSGKVSSDEVPVATVLFDLDEADLNDLPESIRSAKLQYRFTRYLDDSSTHGLVGAPERPTYGDIKADLARLGKHLDKQMAGEGTLPSAQLEEITSTISPTSQIFSETATKIYDWLEKHIADVDEDDEKENARLSALQQKVSISIQRDEAVRTLQKRIPLFVLFNNYFRVKPVIHLGRLARRIASEDYDDEYDYGNICLMKLLGLNPQRLSEMGKSGQDGRDTNVEVEDIRDELDARQYELNSASIMLTEQIRDAWKPNLERGEANTLRIIPDGQYFKVVVVDDEGVEVELDQRSEGFQWLVSFFVVFFAEAEDQHENAILLLDEPGLHLHGLKQREFRDTLSRLAEANQTIYTTHSPFLVGPDELDRVRVVELLNRKVGTKLHTSIMSSDPAGLLPLQEALGYDLAQSLFSQTRNFVVEGLTDYWYISAVADLFEEAGQTALGSNVSIIPAGSASKIVYFATILHAQNLKVVALLDSDQAGDNAASKDSLVHSLGHKGVLRTLDFLDGEVVNPETEDLLRETLQTVAKEELGIDLFSNDTSASKSVASIIKSHKPNLSKNKLAKAFVKWCRAKTYDDLSVREREQWAHLFNKAKTRLK